MEMKWIDGSIIKVSVVKGNTVISANREGLLSLSGQIRSLADEHAGGHIHYDEYNSLEDGSTELIIEKILTNKTDE